MTPSNPFVASTPTATLLQRRAGAVYGLTLDAERLRSRRHPSRAAPGSMWRFLKPSPLLAVLLPFLICAGAPPPPAPPVEKTAAEEAKDAEAVRELMRAGVGEYKKGNLEAARDSFLKAWAIRPHYAIAA